MKALIRWLKNFIHPPKGSRINLGRRATLAAGVGGLTGGMLLRTHPQAGKRSFNPALVRPPGSVEEEEFLAKCIRCGECMKVCPTNGLHPASFEGGIEGIWTPVFQMRMGYCEYECTLCTQVCPTDAIRELTVEEKQKTKVGLAFFDKNRCLPYALGRSCIVCEEHCPTPTKAIWFEEVEVTDRDGNRTTVKQPHVDPELCIGCGICVNKCPVEDEPAIYVTSVGESRHPENQILLDDLGGMYS